jgi:menaquinone-dependent protoporphyrinogen oxidase
VPSRPEAEGDRLEDDMRVLVTYASKHAATAGIAKALGTVLREESDHALDVDVFPVDEVAGVEDYDAVVVGSAVYMGRWMDTARGLVRRNQKALRCRPVWLFSSGPLGEPAVPAQDAADGSDLAEKLGARAHRTFAGSLRRAELGRGERLAVRLVNAPEGDYRDWVDIRHWGEEIVDALTAPVEV